MLHQTHPPRRWKQWLALPLFALLFGTAAHGQTASPPLTEAPYAPPNPRPTPPPPPAVYQYADEMPLLPSGGGFGAIVAFIRTHLIYPEVTAAEQREGRVVVGFIVTKNGEVQALKILESLAPAYDKAVLAAVRQLPRLRPGRQYFQDGPRPVAVSYTVPIKFVLLEE